MHVRIDREVRPKRVVVHSPDDFAGAVDGVEYEWSTSNTEETGHDRRSMVRDRGIL